MSANPVFQAIRHRRRLFTLAIGIGMSLLLALTPLQPSAAIFVEDVPNPQEINGTWVTDSAEMLSSSTEAELNQMIAELEATNETEIAVVTVPDTQGSASPKAFATELFNTWGIGKEGADNGVLFLISKGDRRNEVETGYGVEGILTDARLGSILEKQVTPQFKAGNFDAGVLAGTEAMIGLLNGEAVSPLVSVREYTSWVFNGLSAAVVAIAVTTTTALKRLNKNHRGHIKVLPTGRESLQPKGVFLGSLLAWVLRGLIGTEMSKKKGLCIAAPKYQGAVGFLFNLTTPSETTDLKGNRLVGYQLSNDIVKSGWKLFGLGYGIAVVTVLIFSVQAWVVPLLSWMWLGYELWVNHGADNILDSSFASTETRRKSSSTLVLKRDIKAPVGQRLQQTTRQLMGISLYVALILFCTLIVLQVLGLLLLPHTSAALFFTCAGIFRLVRSLPNNPQVICQTCDGALEALSKPELQQHLTSAEQVEVRLQTKRYEGWRCPSCSEQVEPDSLSVHLFYQDRYKHGYEDCLACGTRTVQVTQETLQHATTTATGIAKTTRHCHACDAHSEQEITIAKRRASSGSGSSYSGSYGSSSSGSSGYSGSSYSGSSDSGSSGGSFGGGSSGGGGAGSDW